MNPRYAPNFVENYPLGTVLSYSMSDDTGTILAYKKDV